MNLHRDPPAPPVRVVHLGLGNFFRAHQAWYTAHSADAAEWGIAAFAGRSAGLSDALTQQDGLYTLIVRSADGDNAEVIASIARAHAGSDVAALSRYLSDPQVAVVTLTVTEAGYLRSAGDLQLDHPEIRADVEVWSVEAGNLRTAPARLAAALSGRRDAGAGPIAIVSCDNLAENGRAAATAILGFARAVDTELADWIAENVSFVTTMVDRITPATTDEDRQTAATLTGCADAAPVVTEPFAEWVLSGSFPQGRPAWETAGALFVDDLTPYEERKLWLLNGGHSLLAYLGSARGHVTVAEAVADERCLAWLNEWWDLAAGYLRLPPADTAAYRQALLDRFTNPRIRHQLAQIATDGSQKLPVRVLPVLHREREAGRLPEPAVRVLAGWIRHLQGGGAPVKDTNAEILHDLVQRENPASAVLGFLDPGLSEDEALIAALDDKLHTTTATR